jgi:hypothetical protein
LVDDVSGWHRQAKIRSVVKLAESVAERRVQLLQLTWQQESEPKRLGPAEVAVRQDVELELCAPAHEPLVLREPRRDGNERGAQGWNLWPFRLQTSSSITQF